MPRLWPVVLCALVLAGCGGSGGGDDDRLSLTTPKDVRTATATPTPSPSAEPEASARPRTGPVTAVEKRVIRGWADSLRRGDVDEAVSHFTVPAITSNGDPPTKRLTRGSIREFNESLTCGAKLESTERDARYVVATFRLTERRGSVASCGSGVGNKARTAFLIQGDKIAQWIRAPDPSDASDAPGGTTS